MDALSKSLGVAGSQKTQKEMEERMGALHTALNKVEASITKYEDLLEESQIQEEEAHYGDQG